MCIAAVFCRLFVMYNTIFTVFLRENQQLQIYSPKVPPVPRKTHNQVKHNQRNNIINSNQNYVNEALLATGGQNGLYCRGIVQGAGVPNRVLLFVGNLAQDAAHDFATARAGQLRHKMDDVWRGNGSNDLAHHGNEFLLELGVALETLWGVVLGV